MPDRMEHALADAIPFHDLFSGFPGAIGGQQLTDLTHDCFVQARIRVLRANQPRTRLPSTRQLIRNVLSVRSGIEMCRIATWRVIAAMQYMQAGGKFAVMNYIRNNVRPEDAGPSLAALPEPPIAVMGSRGGPWPAFVGTSAIDFLMEPGDDRR